MPESTRTANRRMKVNCILETIGVCTSLLTFEKKDLERGKAPDFKRMLAHANAIFAAAKRSSEIKHEPRIPYEPDILAYETTEEVGDDG